LCNLGSATLLTQRTLDYWYVSGQVYDPVSKLDEKPVNPSSTKMGDASEKIAIQSKITSREHEEILDTIDKIREQGISRYVDIPQIVVVGDQSSGKKSVLALNPH
jgi:hypothetical protein